MKWEVMMGNVGLWAHTDSEQEARREYWRACKHVLQNGGRAEGEQVHLLCDGEPVESYYPSNGNHFED